MNSSESDRPIILLVSSNSSSRGGGEKYLVYLADGLRELGWEVHALLSTIEYMTPWAIELKQAGGIVHRLNLKSLIQRPLRCLQSTLDNAQIGLIAQFCKDLRPAGVVVNQQYDEDGLDYLAGVMMSGCKRLCGVMHMPMTTRKNDRFLGRFRGILLRSWYARHPYPLVLVSEGAQREFERYYPMPRPTYVVNNAIPAAPSYRSGERVVWSNDVPVIGFIGQFVSQKNILFLIEGWLVTLRSGLQSRLLLIGDGPQRLEIELYLWANAPPGSWFITGWTENPQKYFSNIDLFVLLSHFEGLSLSMLEMASQGIPGLIADFNGGAEVLERAPWVLQTSNCDLSRYVTDLRARLADLETGGRASETQLSQFKQYFSSQRMALEILGVLGLGYSTRDEV